MEVVILDFETTGLSPSYSRVIEVGAVIVKGTKIVDQISQLMHPGTPVPYFITRITGITNQMLKGKPTPEDFMPKLKNFIGQRPILAHNASFDQNFLLAEMENAGITMKNAFLCTLKLARRLYPDAPNHKLGTLATYLKLTIPQSHQSHRALDDVLMTAQVWFHFKKMVAKSINNEPDLNLFIKLAGMPKNKIASFLENYLI